MGGKKDSRNKGEPDKGRLLYESIEKEQLLMDIGRQKRLYKRAWILLILQLMAFIILLYALLTTSLKIDDLLFIILVIVSLSLGIFICLWAIYNISFSKDQIYENGVSSFIHTIIDYYKGETFTPFKDITKIEWGYGTTRAAPNKPFRFLAIYKNNENKHTTIFTDKYYINNFFEILIKTLKEKCPNVPWIQVDYNSLPWPK